MDRKWRQRRIYSGSWVSSAIQAISRRAPLRDQVVEKRLLRHAITREGGRSRSNQLEGHTNQQLDRTKLGTILVLSKQIQLLNVCAELVVRAFKSVVVISGVIAVILEARGVRLCLIVPGTDHRGLRVSWTGLYLLQTTGSVGLEIRFDWT